MDLDFNHHSDFTLDRICSYSMDNVEETHGENGS